jgi:hypothetical protein
MSPRPLAAFAAFAVAFSYCPAVRAEDAPKPDATAITKVEQTVAQVPHPLFIALRGGPKQNDAATQITNLLRTNVEGRTATLKIKVDRVETYRNKNEQADRYRIKTEDGRLQEVGTNLHVLIWVHFDPSENAKVSTKKKGDELTVTGKITTASATGQNNPTLHLDLDEAKAN